MVFDLKDVSTASSGVPSLTLSSLAVNTTAGYSTTTPDCPVCCYAQDDFFSPDPVDIVVNGLEQISVNGTNSCTGFEEDVTAAGFGWGSNNANIAQVTKAQAKGIAFGQTFGFVEEMEGCGCGERPVEVEVPINVFQFSVTGNSYIFVGTDSHIKSANSFFATNGNGGNPEPAGGTFGVSSSDSKDSYTKTSNSPPILEITTPDQSATDGDRHLTFTYSLSGGLDLFPMDVTARQFAYLTNDSPFNACSPLPFGTDRTYTYTVYTHPDKTAVNSDSGLEDTPVSESFSPSVSCGAVTGNAALNANDQFTDRISSGCSNTPLTCTQTVTQTLSVAGVKVRTNTLAGSSTGITYTSDGPSQ